MTLLQRQRCLFFSLQDSKTNMQKSIDTKMIFFKSRYNLQLHIYDCMNLKKNRQSSLPQYYAKLNHMRSDFHENCSVLKYSTVCFFALKPHETKSSEIARRAFTQSTGIISPSVDL